VKESFNKVLSAAGEAAHSNGTHVLLIVDALNQLTSYNSAWSLDWLPTFIPIGVRCMLSVVPEHPCAVALGKRDPRPPVMEIPGLTAPEKEEIVRQQLAEYRKKLNPLQMRLLLDKKESPKPLFLLTACEVSVGCCRRGGGGGGVF